MGGYGAGTSPGGMHMRISGLDRSPLVQSQSLAGASALGMGMAGMGSMGPLGVMGPPSNGLGPLGSNLGQGANIGQGGQGLGGGGGQGQGADGSIGGLGLTNVTRQTVTSPATEEASRRRRRTDANFVCPVPGCGSTFTRHFNLKGTCSLFFLLFSHFISC